MAPLLAVSLEGTPNKSCFLSPPWMPPPGQGILGSGLQSPARRPFSTSRQQTAAPLGGQPPPPLFSELLFLACVWVSLTRKMTLISNWRVKPFNWAPLSSRNEIRILCPSPPGPHKPRNLLPYVGDSPLVLPAEIPVISVGVQTPHVEQPPAPRITADPRPPGWPRGWAKFLGGGSVLSGFGSGLSSSPEAQVHPRGTPTPRDQLRVSRASPAASGRPPLYLGS